MAPDPYYYDAFSPIRIKFHSYGRPLPREGILNAVRTAFNDVVTHDGPSPINRSEVIFGDWTYGLIALVLKPQRQMKWMQLEDTIVAVHQFIEDYDPVELRFDVEINGGLVIGSGGLVGQIGAVGRKSVNSVTTSANL